jgi:hypothetical protein
MNLQQGVSKSKALPRDHLVTREVREILNLASSVSKCLTTHHQSQQQLQIGGGEEKMLAKANCGSLYVNCAKNLNPSLLHHQHLLARSNTNSKFKIQN